MIDTTVLFVSSGKAKLSPSPIVLSQATSLKDNSVFVSHFTINKKGAKGYLKEGCRLRRFLKENTYDIIHAHYGLTALVALFAKNREKLVVSFMGDDIVGSNNSDGSVTKTSLILARINIFLSRWFYSHSIVKSAEMLSKISHKKVSLIPNGVNLKVFGIKEKALSRTKLDLDINKKIILFVSDPSRSEKNYSLALKAVNQINQKEILLLPVFGLDQESLTLYYNAADVIILTSYHEGSPNVIKEAMACSCPIVSTNVGDVEWVFGNTNGCFLTSFDPTDVAEKLKLALKFSDEFVKTTGRERIIQLGLDSETVASKISNIYKSLMN